MSMKSVSKSSVRSTTLILRDNQDEPIDGGGASKLDKKVRFVLTEKEIEREATVGLANVTFLSCAFSVLMIPILGIRFLQEVRHRGLLTYVHILTRHSISNISILFMSIKVLDVLKFKRTFQMGIVGYGIYALANLFYTWATVITTSLLFGIVVSHMWVAQAVYIAVSAFSCAELTAESSNIKLAHFFGVFQFLMFVASFVDSCTSMFLSDRSINEYNEIAFPTCYNSTFIEEHCGAAYKHNTNLTKENINGTCATNFQSYHTPNTITANFTMVIYIVMFAFASYIVHSTVKEIEISSQAKTTVRVYFRGLKLMHERNQILLVPITIYVGYQSVLPSFSLYAFIACPVGDELVSYMKILMCLSSCCICLLYQTFVRHIGRNPMLCLAIVIDFIVMLLLLTLPPYPEHPVLFYIFTILWGIRDAIWEIENVIDYALNFRNRLPEAYVNLHFWRKIGIILYVVMKEYFITGVVMSISLALLMVSVISIVILKFSSSSKINHEEEDDHPGTHTPPRRHSEARRSLSFDLVDERSED